MYLKKLSAVLTAAALLIAGTAVLPARAEDNTVIHVQVDKVQVTPDQVGEPVTVTMYLPDTDPDIAYFQCGLRYDSRLTLLSQKGISTTYFSSSVHVSSTDPYMWISGAGASSIESGTLLTCTFRLPADAAPGDMFEVCYMPDTTYFYDDPDPAHDLWGVRNEDGTTVNYGDIDGAVVWEDGYIEVVDDDAPAEEPTQDTSGDDAVIHIHVDKVQVTPDQLGAPVTVTAYLSDTDPDIANFDCGLRYDSRLTLLSKKGMSSENFYVAVAQSSVYPFLWMSGGNDDMVGTFITCTFQLPADAVPGDVFEICYMPDNGYFDVTPDPNGISYDIWDVRNEDGTRVDYADIDGAVVWEDGYIEVVAPDAQEPTEAMTNVPVEEPTQAVTDVPAEESTQGPAVTIWGDADDDGDCDIIDVITVNKEQLGSETLSAQGAVNADVDRSGALSFTDAVNIMKSLVDLVTLPVEE